MKFVWDPEKERVNLARHGVDFATAQKAFSDPRARVAFDAAHSHAGELRWWLLGRVAGRVLLVRYTHRPPPAWCASSAPVFGEKEKNDMNKQNNKSPAPVFDAEGYQANMSDVNGEPLPDLAALRFRPLHGGARPGSGRKPSGRVPLTLRLRPAVAARLRAAAKKQGKTLSEFAEERLAPTL